MRTDLPTWRSSTRSPRGDSGPRAREGPRGPGGGPPWPRGSSISRGGRRPGRSAGHRGVDARGPPGGLRGWRRGISAVPRERRARELPALAFANVDGDGVIELAVVRRAGGSPSSTASRRATSATREADLAEPGGSFASATSTAMGTPSCSWRHRSPCWRPGIGGRPGGDRRGIRRRLEPPGDRLGRPERGRGARRRDGRLRLRERLGPGRLRRTGRALFRRGDVDGDGRTTIRDAVAILGGLFLGASLRPVRMPPTGQ